MIELNNKKLHDLIIMKDELVKTGRKISSELETLEFKIQKYQDKEKVITAKTEPKDLMTKGEIIRLELERKMKEFDEMAEKIRQAKLEAIPTKMKEEHFALMKKREEMERERNKIALKIQKIKDKLVPLLKKELTPLLQEYEDTETVEVKEGKVLVKTFNYLEDFKKEFHKKRAS